MPNSAPVHNNLGYILENEGRLAEAVTHYEEALRLDPANERARDNLRRAREQLLQQPRDGADR
jgi:Flp pilus assembly protein TadD